MCLVFTDLEAFLNTKKLEVDQAISWSITKLDGSEKSIFNEEESFFLAIKWTKKKWTEREGPRTGHILVIIKPIG